MTRFLSLRDLIDAAESVIENWEEGDLAGAVSDLSWCIDDAKEDLKQIEKYLSNKPQTEPNE
jgi:hypothetical protein